jgi:MFS family permease
MSSKPSPTQARKPRLKLTRGRTEGAEPAPQLLLASQLIFNIGFFSVVPFLAVAMRDDFGMGAMAIGIVLGARTFAQQGLFLFGGALADYWGARQSLIAGCLVRLSGFLLLVWAADFPLFLLGAVVTGIGGALFSPALQSLVAYAAARGGASQAGAAQDDATRGGGARKNHGSSLFALLVVCGEVGAVVGPLLGSLLLNTGFDNALLIGAGVFAVMAAVFFLFIPRTRPEAPKTSAKPAKSSPPSGLWSCLREKRFIGFAAFYSVSLLAANQLYFGLPVELERSGAGVSSMAVVFAFASVLTISLQWPIARLMRKAGPRIALPLGFSLQSAGFASLAVMATFPAPSGLPFLPAILWVSGLALGNMCVTPVAMGLVLEFAAGRPTGAFYGLLASSGGLAVVIGNAALAPLYELASVPSINAGAPWLVLCVYAAISATAIPRFLPKSPAKTTVGRKLQAA